MQQAMTCPNCGGQSVAGQQFCTTCGARLVGETQQQAITCPNCGAQSVAGQQFCTACGASLLGGGQEQVWGMQQEPSATPVAEAGSPPSPPSPSPQKYGVLGGAYIIFRIIGWVVLVGGSLFSIAMAVMASQGVASIADVSNIFPEAAGAGIALMALVGIIMSLLWGLFLLAFAELCAAVVDIEQRTR